MAGLSPGLIQQKQALADTLQAAADDAAGHVRNLYIVFLSFGLYLAITVGGTTDEQLLRGSPVRLPIIDVSLPLFAFYWVAPALFVLFHFNLLVQLTLLSEKLRRLDAALGGLPDAPDRRATLSPFVFTQMLIGDHGAGDGRFTVKALLHLIGWTTFVLLPLAVLLLAQIQFLPYHDAATTWWHRSLIAVDLLLLWSLWLPAIAPGSLRRVRVVMRRRLRRFGCHLAEPLDWPAWPIIGLLGLLRGLFTLPLRIRRRIRDDLGRDWRLLRLQEVSAICLIAALLVVTIPEAFLAGPMDYAVGPRGSIGFNRNLSLPEAKLLLRVPDPIVIETAGEARALANYTAGLDLKDRNLRFAILSDVDMRKADLRAADLQGADLGGADLQGADLFRADLQGANLFEADLQGANLFEADLQGANLFRADLQGAILSRAHLWRARLGDEPDARWRLADLRGADVEPVGLEALIAEMQEQIPNEELRARVVESLESALRDDDRPDLPAWQGQPQVMFRSDDPIAMALDWGEPTMTDAAYDQELAAFLGDLACGEDASPTVAERLARRAAVGEPDRLLRQLLAARLTSEDPGCPAAAELAEGLRADLEEIAARLDQPAPE